MKFKIFKFESVTSTNDVAINLIKEKHKEIGCIYAKKQTEGRGTHGKYWVSDEGNLFGSIFFPLKDDYPPFNEFSIINPVIISSVIENFCKKKNITFKRPNDVFVNQKKICGILQELITVNSRKFLIIGIGLNIISNPKINTKYQTTNILFDPKYLLGFSISGSESSKCIVLNISGAIKSGVPKTSGGYLFGTTSSSTSIIQLNPDKGSINTLL